MGRVALLSFLGLVLLSCAFARGTSLPSSSADAALPKTRHRGETAPVTDDDVSADNRDDEEIVFDDNSDDEERDDDDDDDDAAGDDLVDDRSLLDVSKLDDEELRAYLELEDQIFLCQTDEHVAGRLLAERQALYSKDSEHRRRKRIAPLVGRAAFAVGRYMFRRFANRGITRSGSRVTRHYSRPGSYNNAVSDFNRLRPTNVRNIGSGGRMGQTGTVGPHRVTVRNWSSARSGNRPTLEVRSHNGNLVRKFRFE